MAKKRIISAVLAFSALMSQSVFAQSFTDISGHWAEQSIVAIAQKGVVNGVTDTLFVPDGEVTRAQYLKMIMEATGLEKTSARDGECLDAGVGEWYAPYLQKALDCGLIPEPMVAGYKQNVEYKVDDKGNATESRVVYQGAFNGNLPITREEMAVLTQYVYQYTRTILTNKPAQTDSEKSFADGNKINEWARASVEQAVANGFMDGMENDFFNPQFTATRAQASVVILRVLNKVGE